MVLWTPIPFGPLKASTQQPQLSFALRSFSASIEKELPSPEYSHSLPVIHRANVPFVVPDFWLDFSTGLASRHGKDHRLHG
jgi:hypothetical protein